MIARRLRLEAEKMERRVPHNNALKTDVSKVSRRLAQRSAIGGIDGG